MAKDAVPELLDQLQTLEASTKALDLLLVSDGGDPTVAWSISLHYDFVSPQRDQSSRAIRRLRHQYRKLFDLLADQRARLMALCSKLEIPV